MPRRNYTNISNSSCRRGRTPNSAVIRNLDDCAHHTDSDFNDAFCFPTLETLSQPYYSCMVPLIKRYVHVTYTEADSRACIL